MLAQDGETRMDMVAQRELSVKRTVPLVHLPRVSAEIHERLAVDSPLYADLSPQRMVPLDTVFKTLAQNMAWYKAPFNERVNETSADLFGLTGKIEWMKHHAFLTEMRRERTGWIDKSDLRISTVEFVEIEMRVKDEVAPMKAVVCRETNGLFRNLMEIVHMEHQGRWSDPAMAPPWDWRRCADAGRIWNYKLDAFTRGMGPILMLKNTVFSEDPMPSPTITEKIACYASTYAARDSRDMPHDATVELVEIPIG